MSNWGNPLKDKKSKKVKEDKPEKEVKAFKAEKPTLSKSEAKKILASPKDLSNHQIFWVQKWLEQRIRERSLPPQLSGGDAFGSILRYLAPRDATSLLEEIRSEFQRTKYEEMPLKEEGDYPLSALKADILPVF